MSSSQSRRPLAVLILAVLLVIPLVAMSSAAGEGEPASGWRFTYSPGDEDEPTLFIGPDRIPLATWEGGDGVLHLSRLNLTADSKLGVTLSNLPRAVAAVAASVAS